MLTQLIPDRRHGLQAAGAGTAAHAVEQVRFSAKLRLHNAAAEQRAVGRERANRRRRPRVGAAGLHQ
jgi:hypothetical protein